MLAINNNNLSLYNCSSNLSIKVLITEVASKIPPWAR